MEMSMKLLFTYVKPRGLPRVLRCYSQHSTARVKKIEKSILSELRKRTGYGFNKCLEALQMNDNDVDDAENWLAEQAQKEGWKTAEKLKSRTTSQGLIGAAVDGNITAMVEVGCETDFVARNDEFKELVAKVTKTALQFRKKVIRQNKLLNSFEDEDIAHVREIVPNYQLGKTIFESDVAPLQDIIVDSISRLGENIKLKRVVTIASSSHNVSGIYGHGNSSGSIGNFVYGQYASVVTLEPYAISSSQADISKVAQRLAQHVTGMNPKVIDIEPGDKNIEDALLNQEYLLDNSLTVREVLSKYGVRVVDFIRYQLGS